MVSLQIKGVPLGSFIIKLKSWLRQSVDPEVSRSERQFWSNDMILAESENLKHLEIKGTAKILKPSSC